MASLGTAFLRLLGPAVQLQVLLATIAWRLGRRPDPLREGSRRRLLVIFPDEWLAYSPTVLNLVALLSAEFEVSVVMVDSGDYTMPPDLPARIVQVRLGSRTTAVLRVLHLVRVARAVRLAAAVAALAAPRRFDEVVGVDAVGAWVGAHCHGSVHYLSLELERHAFFRALDPAQLLSVTIQTPERLNHLFPDGVEAPVFLVQNAPRMEHAPPPTPREFSPRVVLLGNALPSHGVYTCIDALRRPEAADYELTVKGVIPADVRRAVEQGYGDLLSTGRLVLDEGYVPQQHLLHYLSQFAVGLCFYDFDLLTEGDFNYLSCPSGKLFNYYAAGVPVIGSDILGLASVMEFETGVLLAAPTPDGVARALEQVRTEHDRLVRNCRKAAHHFDFSAAVRPLRTLLASGADHPLT